MTDSAGVSNLNPEAPKPTDPLGAALPSLGNFANVIHGLVQSGLTIDEAAQKVAVFVDPAIVPALKTLAAVLQAVEKYV